MLLRTDIGDSARLAQIYGLAIDETGGLPALAAAGDGAITLVDFFRLRATALYEDGRHDGGTGVEAMLRYAATSGRCLEAVGGRFLVQALPAGVLWGQDDDWDLVVVAEYPSRDAFLTLLADADYEQAFVHRRAAVERQRVTAAATLS
jgi:uncharacterized protein (DUF1330 family)